GAGALLNNFAADNTATGYSSLKANITGNDNTATGSGTLFSNTTGSANTAVGAQALFLNDTGQGNTAIGFGAGLNIITANNVICIGTVPGADVDNSCYIGSIFGQTSANGIPVLVNSSHKLGTTTSSKRFKEDIKPMDKASEAVF